MMNLRSIVLMAILAFLIFPASALPKYAEETGQECVACHTNPATGELNDVGKAFRLTHKWPPEEKADLTIVFAIGFLHLLSIVLWIGAIFFVHLVHTPDVVAMGGAPKKELMLGWAGIVGTGISGALLTSFRFSSLADLINSTSGIIVLAKIAIYIFMVFTATTLTLYLNKKFRIAAVMPGYVEIGNLREFRELSRDKGILVSVGGLVYDLSSSPLWKNGVHAGKHEAWRDLTQEIKDSPHGMAILSKFKPVGYLSDYRALIREIGFAMKVFKIFAYSNLILGITAIFLSAYLRWML